MTPVFRAKSTAVFDGLYRRHVASIYRYAYAVLGNHADAEDVTQQTFLNAYRSISQGTKPRKAENWLLTIAHNEVRRHFRDTRGRSLEVELDEQVADAEPERSDVSVADVVRALQHLPPAQRSALVMREFEGRSYKEIAEIMNVTQGALEALIFRARRSLADELGDALTCGEAERALSRRIDGRLPRRDARRLKAHLRECAQCVRFERLQRQQRSLLKGLSVLPVPASLFLFRGESAAAAAGLGAGTATAGAGAGGIATGLAAKAAAVTAAAAVAGGVGYQVAADPAPGARAEPKAALATGAETSDARAALVDVGRPSAARRAPARPPSGRLQAPARKAKGPARKAGPRARASTKAKKVPAPGSTGAGTQGAHPGRGRAEKASSGDALPRRAERVKVLRAKTRLQKARPTGKPAAPKGRMRSDRPKERKRPDRPKRTDAAPLKPVKPQREPTTPPAKEEPKVKLDSKGAKPAAP